MCLDFKCDFNFLGGGGIAGLCLCVCMTKTDTPSQKLSIAPVDAVHLEAFYLCLVMIGSVSHYFSFPQSLFFIFLK